jgi:hypothetical protein
MLSTTTLWMPQAASSIEAERRSNRRDGLARRLEIKRHAPAQEEAGIVIAEHEIGVGHGRLGAAHAVAGRTGIGAAECGPTLSRPTSSIAAIEPPPAPISIMSMTAP